jgi:hypothetical protein
MSFWHFRAPFLYGESLGLAGICGEIATPKERRNKLEVRDLERP